ncbi:hypothetical protein CIB84_014957 [Bambusicola thoracicus]|uniref:Uncharacterized protein n=1 Tax=Bambusicola thoracicus TaxID=9083 RepID=A0A2P4SB09_BAMTH|nr:hypothetical protein CIB84_014957 [Bambusicola thoracicus]
MQQLNMEEKMSTQGSAYGRDVNLSSGRGFPSLPIYRINIVPEMLCLQD